MLHIILCVSKAFNTFIYYIYKLIYLVAALMNVLTA